MCDANAISEVKRTCALEDDFDDTFNRQQFIRSGKVFECSARNEFHHDIAEILGDDRIKNLNDMRVHQLADKRRFVQEQMRVKFAALRVLEDFRESDLERHFPLGKGVITQIDRRRSAAAQFANNVVFPDFIHAVGA